MKIAISLIFGICLSSACWAQSNEITPEFIQQEIARGRTYIVAFLKAGPQREGIDQATLDQNQANHLNHLFAMKEQGKLAIFGPFMEDGELRGLCIFASKDINEVKQLLEEDPHIKSGYLTYEIHTWFGLPQDKLPD